MKKHSKYVWDPESSGYLVELGKTYTARKDADAARLVAEFRAKFPAKQFTAGGISSRLGVLAQSSNIDIHPDLMSNLREIARAEHVARRARSQEAVPSAERSAPAQLPLGAAPPRSSVQDPAPATGRAPAVSGPKIEALLGAWHAGVLTDEELLAKLRLA